jgi:hypothetical protein
MNKKSASLLVLLMIAAATLATVTLRKQHRATLQLTNESAYRFEPQSHPVVMDGKRPMVAASASDAVYLLSVEDHNGDAGLYLRMSHDQGDNWMEPELISDPHASVNASAENAPQLAVHGMYAYALWQEHSEKEGSQLRLARSSGMEEKPPVPVPITDKAPADKSYTGFASLGVAPDGDIYAVWLDGRDNSIAASGTFNVYLARSTDKGQSFHKNVKVAALACPCCRPSVAFGPSGKVYVAYRHVNSQNVRDVAVAVSSDYGEHFSDPVIIAHDNWKLDGCPESGPVMATPNGRLIVAWYTAANKAGIRAAESSDGGKTFSPELNLSRDVLDANHPYMASNENGDVAVVFSGRAPASNGSWGTLHPFVVNISPDGQISAPQAIPGDTEGDHYPTATLAQGSRLFVAGAADRNQQKICYLSRARRND